MSRNNGLILYDPESSKLHLQEKEISGGINFEAGKVVKIRDVNDFENAASSDIVTMAYDFEPGHYDFSLGLFK